MTQGQIKITFDQIREGDLLDVVWAEDGFVQTVHGTVAKLYRSTSGKFSTWYDETGHIVADNWSRNQDRATIWLNTNPKYKAGDMVDALIGADIRPRIATVIRWEGRNYKGDDVYTVKTSPVLVHTVVESGIKGIHVPPFEVGDRVQTKSTNRVAEVVGLSSTPGFMRVKWEDNGISNSLAYGDLVAHKEPKPISDEVSAELESIDALLKTYTTVMEDVQKKLTELTYRRRNLQKGR